MHDVIGVVLSKMSRNAWQTLTRLSKQAPELHARCHILRINGKGKKTPVADAGTLHKIAIACLRQSRMSHVRKQQKLREMGCPQEDLMRVYVEEETLAPINKVFATLNPIKQFTCGRYRIDLYFPAQKVAVECEEHGHNTYSLEAELTRQKFLEHQLGCKFVRYNPHNTDLDIHELMAKLLPL